MDCNNDWNIEFEIPILDVLFSSFCSLEKATTLSWSDVAIKFCTFKTKGNIRAPFPDASQLYTEERHHLHYHKQTPGERWHRIQEQI